MANWGSVVPIIVAIIGVSGFIIPVFSTPIINQNKPNVNIDIGTQLENGKEIIDVTNTGTVPATNLSLIVTANNKIINNITNLFSTVNVTLAVPGPDSLLEIGRLKPINGSFVELHVKKFVNGYGSIIKLAIGAKGTTLSDYTVYATYDQGSNRVIGTDLVWPNDVFTNLRMSFYFMLYSFVAFAIVFGYLFLIWLKKRLKKEFIAAIAKDMMDFRKFYRLDPLTPHIISDFNWTYIYQNPIQPSDYPFPYHYGAKFANYIIPRIMRGDKRILTNEINDYLRVDDFYSKLAERNSYINKGVIDDIVLKKLNKECLDLAEAALEKIDWSKYK